MRYPELESNTLELKREFPREDQIIKTIIGFCNQHGGKLIVGIDSDRQVVGLPDKAIEEALESLDHTIYQACVPPIIPRIYSQRIGEKSVLVIEVAEGMNKPYYRKSEGLTKGTYVRLGRHTLRATQEVIEELKWQTRGIDFERLPVYQATKSDLDLEKFQEFLKTRKNHGKVAPSTESLRAYHLLVSEHTKTYPTTAGILLFGKNPQHHLSEAMIVCSHFRGKSGREAIATVDCEGTITDQFEQAFSFVLGRLYRSFTIRGAKRTEKLEISEVAVREALLNAIVHRNYHIKAPTKIAIYDDRVEFYSPGGFPSLLNATNLQSGITYLRNPAICKVFREMSYIEKMGTGFITIFQSYEARGLAKPQITEGENYVKCVLPRATVESSPKQDTDLQTILDLIDRKQKISVQDVITELAVSRATATRKLNQLVDKQMIIRVGQTRRLRYKKRSG